MNVRSFAALTLTPTFLKACAAAESAFVEVDPTWAEEKWVAIANLHVTLHFFGDVPEGLIPGLVAELRERTRGMSPPVLTQPRVSAHPSARRARMLWVALDDPDGYAAELSRAAVDVARDLGLEPTSGGPGRRFQPHVTLCRARRPRMASEDAVRLANVAFMSDRSIVSDPACTVFSSRLASRGPVYSVLDQWGLQGE